MNNDNNDVTDAWILDKFQVLSDKLGEWFGIDNFWIARKLGLVFVIFFTITVAISIIDTETFIIKIAMTALFVYVIIICSVYRQDLLETEKNTKNRSDGVTILNPLRSKLISSRLIALALLMIKVPVKLLFFPETISIYYVNNFISILSLYLCLIFSSLNFNKPKGKTIKERLKEYLEKKEFVPSPA